MSRRLLVVGSDEPERARLARALDESFDVDIDLQPDAVGALRVLPQRTYDLIVVHAEAGEVSGLDLVRFLREHPLHQGVPLVFVGGSEDERRGALALGARQLVGTRPDASEIRAAVRELLQLG